MGTAMTESAPREGWLLFDDSCGVCRTWINRVQGIVRRRGFEIAPLQADWVARQLDLAPEQRLHDFRLLLPSGQQKVGADAYRYVMRRIWWAYPLYLMSIMPIGRGIFDWSYRTFARNRHKISKTCRLPGAG
jgi:predicted DCC family thiol-disulfide oxidoreductase YuxK